MIKVHLKITLAVTKLFNHNTCCVLTTDTKVTRVLAQLEFLDLQVTYFNTGFISERPFSFSIQLF